MTIGYPPSINVRTILIPNLPHNQNTQPSTANKNFDTLLSVG